jgi:hypothetical protein
MCVAGCLPAVSDQLRGSVRQHQEHRSHGSPETAALLARLSDYPGVRSLMNKLPVMMVTAYGDDDRRRPASELGRRNFSVSLSISTC